MKTILNIFLLTLLLLMVSSPCFAMMSIENVSKERAKELGIQILPKAAGPDVVRVELSFPTTGALKDYHRVDLYISEGEKSVLFVSLREEQSKAGEIVVSFAADRANLEKITVRVVAGAPMNLRGYDLRAKDFVDMDKIR